MITNRIAFISIPQAVACYGSLQASFSGNGVFMVNDVLIILVNGK